MVADSKSDQVSLGAKAEFSHEVAAMHLDGARADRKQIADLRAGEAFSGHFQHFVLARRECFLRQIRTKALEQSIDLLAIELAAQITLSFQHSLDCIEQFRKAILFDHVTGRSALDRFGNE